MGEVDAATTTRKTISKDLLSLGLTLAVACGGTKPIDPPKAPALAHSASTDPEPLCKVLNPQLQSITKQFDLGGALLCEEVPGVVTLGQFGKGKRLDRSLLACVDQNAKFNEAIAAEPAAVSGIEYSTEAKTDANGSIGLGKIAPWLPNVKAASSAGERVHLRLTVTDATWETLPALGRLFEGQNHAVDCLPALCHAESQLVYKLLRGKVQVAIQADDARGFSTGVTVLGSSGNFTVDEASKSSSHVTLGSNEKLVLAVVAKATQPELTDGGDCDGCGARGQACCESTTKCDESLTCVEGMCRPKGSPGAPCDEGRCGNAAICVRGMCRSGCGADGLPCCDRDGCGEGRRCQAGQPARREVTVVDEVVERKGGLFGTDAEVELGSALCGDGRLRARFATTKLEGDSGHCDHAEWMASNDANDCRVKAHVHVSPFSHVRCRIQAFATEIDPRVPTPQALCR